MLFCRTEIASAANKLRRETKSFAQAFSKPEALPLDSARALPLTRWDSVPDPAKGRSPFEPEFRCRSQARSLCTDGTVCFRWIENQKLGRFYFKVSRRRTAKKRQKSANGGRRGRRARFRGKDIIQLSCSPRFLPTTKADFAFYLGELDTARRGTLLDFCSGFFLSPDRSSPSLLREHG